MYTLSTVTTSESLKKHTLCNTARLYDPLNEHGSFFFFSFKHIFTYFQFLVWETSKRTKWKQYNHIQSLKSTNIYKKKRKVKHAGS